MASPATGWFEPGDSWLHRRGPLTKLLLLGLIVLAAFLLPPLALVGLAILVVIAAWTAGLLPQLARSLRVPVVLVASILIVNAFFFPGATHVIASIGPIALSQEGLAFGIYSAARLLVAFIASILFLLTTLADDLLESLIARGVSHRLAFVVLSAVQLVPRQQARAGAILDAQQARGLPVSGSFGTRVRALVPLIGPVLLGALIDVRERTFALEARAFGARPDRTAYRVVADPPIDRWLRLAIIFGYIAVVVVAVSGVGR